MHASYVGRFAPSPSGPLHFGSLVCALASYLDAKASRGRWLVRIEDIDPPREQKGATESILHTLRCHGLVWDDEVLYQSRRSEYYLGVLQALQQQGETYRCSCNRKRLLSLEGVYDQRCLSVPPPANAPAAIRLNIKQCGLNHSQLMPRVEFEDAIQGKYWESVDHGGDFIIHRKDGLFAYQLAVVVDDIEQGITHVVRGIDLLPTTPKQIYLMKLFNYCPPAYAHIPVVNNRDGNKLSKQNHAPAIDNECVQRNLFYACRALALMPPAELEKKSPKEILSWATEHWSKDRLKGMTSVAEHSIISM